MKNKKVSQIEVNGRTYKIGDFVTINEISLEMHTRVIRIDKIVNPHLSYVYECENGQDIFAFNSLLILGLATKEQIENEIHYRDKKELMNIFGPNPDEDDDVQITYAWSLDNIENLVEGTSHIKPSQSPLYVYYDTHGDFSTTNVETGDYCITIEEDCPYHDGEIARYLELEYEDYIKVVLQFNGKPRLNVLQYADDDIHHSTDTWFTNKKDCEDCVQYIKDRMVR
ncbi:hypothetical protein [Bacillus cereus]|uniref:hypothetical protein n=1 Tax=Bacillus cereus TaxID=1396 RepID=UPI000B4AAC28|nr:hypothetical protein [Bacillus cereus]